MGFFMCMGWSPITHILPHFKKCSNFPEGKYHARLAIVKSSTLLHLLSRYAPILPFFGLSALRHPSFICGGERGWAA
jgi:hypothetical protein